MLDKKPSLLTSNYNEMKSLKGLDKLNYNSEMSKAVPMTTPRTNIEKVIETLKEISDEFDLDEDYDFKAKTQWVIKEIVSNKMFKFEENSDTSKEQNMLFQLYSPDFEENTVQKMNNSELSINDDDLEEEKENFNIVINCPKTIKEEKVLPYIPLDSFGVNFDVFEYAEKASREKMLYQVFNSCLSYKDISSLLKEDCIAPFIEELRLGYISEPGAYYHNVIYLFLSLRIFMQQTSYKVLSISV